MVDGIHSDTEVICGYLAFCVLFELSNINDWLWLLANGGIPKGQEMEDLNLELSRHQNWIQLLKFVPCNHRKIRNISIIIDYV